jgi:hypothetical protein
MSARPSYAGATGYRFRGNPIPKAWESLMVTGKPEHGTVNGDHNEWDDAA